MRQVVQRLITAAMLLGLAASATAEPATNIVENYPGESFETTTPEAAVTLPCRVRGMEVPTAVPTVAWRARSCGPD